METLQPVDTDLEPNKNYYKQIIDHIDNCEYYDEESFKELIQTSSNSSFSI